MTRVLMRLLNYDYPRMRMLFMRREKLYVSERNSEIDIHTKRTYI